MGQQLMTDVTAIFFSCRRMGVLSKCIEAFTEVNTYPIKEMIIVNDSGDPLIHEQLKEEYANYTLVLHPENVGLMKSIDLGYPYVKTEYFFHCEDDWICMRGGFIEQSLAIMQNDPKIEEVWLTDYNCFPIEPLVLSANGVEYQLTKETHHKGTGTWHGFSTACGLKRMSDYKKVAPYADVPWTGTIWNRECAIGERYYQLGYRTAVLMEDYATNIGREIGEYVTGWER